VRKVAPARTSGAAAILKRGRIYLIRKGGVATHFEKKLRGIIAGTRTLTPRILVRIQVPQPKLSCWATAKFQKFEQNKMGISAYQPLPILTKHFQ
jgi:hypothetical protein